jgi:hypothetical protein
MYLINGNKLNGSHLSKCVSDSLVAPLFAFKLGAIVLLRKMSSIALIKLVFFTKVKPRVRCIWELFWIRGKIIHNIIFPWRVVVLELGLEVPKGFWLSLQEMVLLISGSEARIFGSTLLGLGFWGF